MNSDLDEILQVFFDETEDHLITLETMLGDLRPSNATEKSINAILRAAHSIKGNSATCGLTNVSRVAHEMESLLDVVRQKHGAITPAAIRILLQGKDQLSEQLQAYRGGMEFDDASVDAMCHALTHAKELLPPYGTLVSDYDNGENVVIAPAQLQQAETPKKKLENLLTNSERTLQIIFVLNTIDFPVDNVFQALAEFGDYTLMDERLPKNQPYGQKNVLYHVNLTTLAPTSEIKETLSFVVEDEDSIQIDVIQGPNYDVFGLFDVVFTEEEAVREILDTSRKIYIPEPILNIPVAAIEEDNTKTIHPVTSKSEVYAEKASGDDNIDEWGMDALAKPGERLAEIGLDIISATVRSDSNEVIAGTTEPALDFDITKPLISHVPEFVETTTPETGTTPSAQGMAPDPLLNELEALDLQTKDESPGLDFVNLVALPSLAEQPTPQQLHDSTFGMVQLLNGAEKSKELSESSIIKDFVRLSSNTPQEPVLEPASAALFAELAAFDETLSYETKKSVARTPQDLTPSVLTQDAKPKVDRALEDKRHPSTAASNKADALTTITVSSLTSGPTRVLDHPLVNAAYMATPVAEPINTKTFAAHHPFMNKSTNNGRTMQRAADRREAAADAISLRVNLHKVEQVVDLVGELVIAQNQLQQTISELDQTRYAHVFDHLQQVIDHTKALQESVLSIRMTPMSTVFNRFYRMVRELNLKLKKNVIMKTMGEHTEMDKILVEKLVDPLAHIVRNAMDHGIEPSEERKAAGKPEQGYLLLRAFHRANSVVIELMDDGRGMHRDKILQKAEEKGLLASRNPAEMSDSEVWQLIFEPGFSTAAQITDVSGRGVGMDVVKQNIMELNGKIDIFSAYGKGMKITLTLPLTLSIMDGMMIDVAGNSFVVPMNNLQQTLTPDERLIKSIKGFGKVVQLDGCQVPLVNLHDLFGLNAINKKYEEGVWLVLQSSENRLVIWVDRLDGQQQVVLKSLERNYKKSAGVFGATIRNDGSVALIIEPADVIDMAAAMQDQQWVYE